MRQVDRTLVRYLDTLIGEVIGNRHQHVGQVKQGRRFLLSVIAKRNGLTELSMGMSADWPLAVQLGATYVRVGSAIFAAARAAVCASDADEVRSAGAGRLAASATAPAGRAAARAAFAASGGGKPDATSVP